MFRDRPVSVVPPDDRSRPLTDRDWLSTSACITHAGKVREINEDACLALPDCGLWVVADGMGGHSAGDVASQMIVDSLREVRLPAPPGDLLDEVERRLHEVNLSLFEAAALSAGACTIGSTVIALLALGEQCAVLWAGDSRAYRLRERQLLQLSTDHSQVQEMVDIGELRLEEAGDHPLANVITRAVGGMEDLQLDFALFDVRDRDRFLLCSDGLYKDLGQEELTDCLGHGDCAAACEALLAAALAGPATDNISAVVVEFRVAD